MSCSVRRQPRHAHAPSPPCPQMVAATSIEHFMLRLRPASLRTFAIAASTAADLKQPIAALLFAEMGLGLAEQLPEQQDEPYHRALLHLVAARAITEGGMDGPTFPVAALQEHLEGAKAAKAACREWRPTALKAALRQEELWLPSARRSWRPLCRCGVQRCGSRPAKAWEHILLPARAPAAWVITCHLRSRCPLHRHCCCRLAAPPCLSSRQCHRWG